MQSLKERIEEWLEAEKHRLGQHNQKRHGFRQSMLQKAPAQQERYHVTANAEEIMRNGFKTEVTDGIGGNGPREFTFTSKDKNYSTRLAKHLNEVERIRFSKDPIREAEKYSGDKVDAPHNTRMIELYEEHYFGGQKLTDVQKAMMIAVSKAGWFSEIPALSFMRGGPRKKYSILAIETIAGKKRVQGEIFGGEEAWEPQSITPVGIIQV